MEVKLRSCFDSIVGELKRRGVSDDEIKQLEKDAERCSQGWSGMYALPTAYIAKIMGISEDSFHSKERNDQAFVEMFCVLSAIHFAANVMEGLSKLESK